MLRVVFVDVDGVVHAVEAAEGDTLMSVAVRRGVPGIVGECGGNASCATCHIWVREPFMSHVGQPDGMEEDLLDMGVTDRRANSRLGCQVALGPEVDGITVDLPPVQP